MLFACIFVPGFAVQASLRAESHKKRLGWSKQSVAILDGPESLPRVFAVNEIAQRQGIEPGITKAQAAECPGIVLRQRMSQQEEAAQNALIDCAFAFSPRVESTAQGVVAFDIAGTERIFGPPEQLLHTVMNRASRLGLKVNVAAAQNLDTARLAAKGFPGITVISQGNEAGSLSPLPLDVLPVSQAQAEVLAGWGIAACRDLALLPSVPLVERLGQPGLALQRLARGEGTDVIVPVNPPLKFEESLELEDAVEDMESLGFILNRLLEQIGARLSSRSLATNELTLRLDLDTHPDRDLKKEQTAPAADSWTRALKLPVPMEDTKTLLKLLQLDLAQHSPGAPVIGVSIDARPAQRRHAQASLFAAASPEPEKLEVTLARIRGVVGEADECGRGKVGAAEVPDSHSPDDFRMAPFMPKEVTKAAPRGDMGEPSFVMSVFRPPVKANVRRRDGQPAHISFLQISSAVVCVGGPWLTSGHWWKSQQWRHEEWDVAVRHAHGMALYRIYRDLRQDAWFVAGLYD